VLKRRLHQANGDKKNVQLAIDLPNDMGTRVSMGTLKGEATTFELLERARKLINPLLADNPAEVALLVDGFDAGQAERVSEALLAALLAATAELPSYKSTPPKKSRLARIRLFGYKAGHKFKRTFAATEGNTLVRSLSMQPPNRLTPTEYVREARKLAAANQWNVTFYDVSELKKRKAGAFLAVAQASPKDDAGILRLRYTPAKKSNKKPVCLVGKGICYDTGGLNLKPQHAMFGMHEDMQGSALALGTLLALTRLKVDYPVEAWLALAMNHIGPKAYKPNDVITAADGTTIEIVHTDAEGRMVLADTLFMVSSNRPRLIIDYATLTGTCAQAIGRNYCGVFSNREDWYPSLIDAGRASGERVWPFPMDADYDQAIESSIADIRQCAAEGGADHIIAARFLQRFVKHDTPWIHVDLSARNRKGGLAHIPTDTTGFGVRFTLNFLLDQSVNQ
jgi:leucyl aminopeptidase